MLTKKHLKLLSLVSVLIFTPLYLINKKYNLYQIARSSITCIVKLSAGRQTPQNYPSKTKLFLTNLSLISSTYGKYVRDTSPIVKKRVLDFEVNISKNLQLCIYPLFDEIFLKRIYHFETNTEEPFIIDAGGNIGVATLYFKLVYPKSKVLVFEPLTENYKLLEKNMQANNIKNVTLRKEAISNTIGTATLYNQSSGTMSTLDSSLKYEKTQETIQTTLLSKFIDQKVDLLKMDIEGAETSVLEELESNSKLHLVDQIIMEYHYNNSSSQNSLPKLLTILENNNFTHEISSELKTPFHGLEKYNFLIHAKKN